MDVKNEARFWGKVRNMSAGESACWTWGGRRNKAGYGWFDYLGVPRLAHRVSFTIVNGEPKQSVLHRCDNPPCVNPHHLYDGSAAQNAADRDSRNRRDVRGERHPASKLSDMDCEVIKALHGTGRYTYEQLAKQYKVHPHTIGQVCRGQRKVSENSVTVRRTRSNS